MCFDAMCPVLTEKYDPCAPDFYKNIIASLSELSVNGEKLVDEEVKRALYGVKQMKEVMWRNEQKHEHLMTSLKHSADKKKVTPTL